MALRPSASAISSKSKHGSLSPLWAKDLVMAPKKRPLVKIDKRKHHDLIAGIPLKPPRVYVAPTRVRVRGEDPTTYSTGQTPLCRHRQPLLWCVICAERQGRG